MLKQTLCGGGWQFREIGSKQWYGGTVPGTLFSDMLRCGLLERPYYRFNERAMWALAEKDYEYRFAFSVSTEVLDKEYQNLVFEGIDTIAQVWLNGSKLADTDNMHRSYRFDVKEMLLAGKQNELVVKFFSPTRYIKARHAEAPLPEFNTASPHGFSQIRKMHSAFGWDAEPAVPDFGLWRDVYIESYDHAKLEHVYVRQIHNGGAVSLKIEAAVEADYPEEREVRIELEAPDGTRQETSASGKGLNITASMDVQNPQIWWPNGYGAQPLYRLTVTLCRKDEQIDSKCVTVGLRTVEVRREKDAAGESFAFVVNQVPVFAKGGNYTPPDKFITMCRGERHERLIKDCVEANFNCIRIWGGAVYPDDELFELCDCYGLMVWHDLMFACALYHVNDAFIENISAELKDNLLRLRNHPCIVLWCGSNENEWFHDYEHELPGLTDDLRMDNLKQYEVVIKDIVSRYDPDRFFWPSSPSSGGGYKDANGYEKGDVHCWYVWYLPAKPYTFYKECTGRFISEFGLESFQNVKTLRNYMEPEDMSPNSEVMDFMQRCSDNHCNMGNAKIMSYVFQEVRPPKDFEEYVFATQYAQAEGIKYGTCHWRRLSPHCMGVLYWQIVDCFPGTTWSGIDYEYRWKILHYYAKRFFGEVLISAEDNGSIVSLFVTSDRTLPFEGHIQWSLRDNRSQILRQGETRAEIHPLRSELVGSLDFSNDLTLENKTSRYLEFSLTDGMGNILSSDTFLFVKPKHFHFVAPDITCEVAEQDSSFEIKVSSAAYARCVRLDLLENDCHFSDNCFDLSAGIPKSVSVRKESLASTVSLDAFKSQLFVKTLNEIG